MTTITGPGGVRRDRYGRPYIKHPTTGKEVSYTRATTVAETLDDRYNLEQWKMRQVAAGLAVRPDLVSLAAAKIDDKGALNSICQDALDAAASGAAANLGTALHSFVETINRGQEPAHVPVDLRADIDAYRIAMADWEVLRAEQLLVLDDIEVAGTTDMIVRHRKTGSVRIADLKTGSGAVTYGQTAIAVQLALYSRGVAYYPETGEREPLGDIDQDKAIVVHAPAGKGTCTLHEVDIAAGWEAVQHALWVRSWRKRRNLFDAMSFTVPEEPDFTPAERIAAAGDVDTLYALHRSLVDRGVDVADLIPVFAARKQQLAG